MIENTVFGSMADEKYIEMLRVPSGIESKKVPFEITDGIFSFPYEAGATYVIHDQGCWKLEGKKDVDNPT
jgi:hypothetical protein